MRGRLSLVSSSWIPQSWTAVGCLVLSRDRRGGRGRHPLWVETARDGRATWMARSAAGGVRRWETFCSIFANVAGRWKELVEETGGGSWWRRFLSRGQAMQSVCGAGCNDDPGAHACSELPGCALLSPVPPHTGVAENKLLSACGFLSPEVDVIAIGC